MPARLRNGARLSTSSSSDAFSSTRRRAGSAERSASALLVPDSGLLLLTAAVSCTTLDCRGDADRGRAAVETAGANLHQRDQVPDASTELEGDREKRATRRSRGDRRAREPLGPLGRGSLCAVGGRRLFGRDRRRRRPCGAVGSARCGALRVRCVERRGGIRSHLGARALSRFVVAPRVGRGARWTGGKSSPTGERGRPAGSAGASRSRWAPAPSPGAMRERC